MSRQEPSIPPAMEQYLQTQIEADERVLWASTSDFSERMRRIRFITFGTDWYRTFSFQYE